MSKAWDQALEEEAERYLKKMWLPPFSEQKQGFLAGAEFGLKWRNGELEKLQAVLSRVQSASGHGSVGACRFWAAEALSILEGLKDA